MATAEYVGRSWSAQTGVFQPGVARSCLLLCYSLVPRPELTTRWALEQRVTVLKGLPILAPYRSGLGATALSRVASSY